MINDKYDIEKLRGLVTSTRDAIARRHLSKALQNLIAMENVLADTENRNSAFGKGEDLVRDGFEAGKDLV